MIVSISLPEAMTMLFLGIELLGLAGWGRTFLKELTLYDAGRGYPISNQSAVATMIQIYYALRPCLSIANSISAIHHRF